MITYACILPILYSVKLVDSADGTIKQASAINMLHQNYRLDIIMFGHTITRPQNYLHK